MHTLLKIYEKLYLIVAEYLRQKTKKRKSIILIKN